MMTPDIFRTPTVYNYSSWEMTKGTKPQVSTTSFLGSYRSRLSRGPYFSQRYSMSLYALELESVLAGCFPRGWERRLSQLSGMASRVASRVYQVRMDAVEPVPVVPLLSWL